jgi:polyferredoxin
MNSGTINNCQQERGDTGMRGKRKNTEPVAPGAGKIWDIQHLRYLSQLGIVIFIAVVFTLKQLYGENTQYASPEAFCPLGGFETLYYTIATGGKFVQHTHFSNMVIFVALLITIVAAGGFFCGWICPLGAIQQAITGFRRWLQKRVGLLVRVGKWLSAKSRSLVSLDPWLRYAKYLVLLWIIWGTITTGTMVFRDLDPWAGILNILEAGITIGFWIFIATALAAFIGDRVWCRYLCPLGAIIGLVGKIGLIRVQRDGESCIGCKICTRKCPMHIQVHEKGRVVSTECNMCLNCVDACPSQGALETRLSLRIAKRTIASQTENSANE